MSRKQFIRLDGDRLEQAIKSKGMTKRDFGLKCFNFMERLGLRKGTGFDDEKQASNWTSLLCRPDDDDRKTGVHPRLLNIIALYLGVRRQWLTGEDDYMTDDDWLQAIDDRQARLEAIAHDTMKRASDKFAKGPVHALIRDKLSNAEVVNIVQDNKPYFRIQFKDDPGSIYTIKPETIRMIEAACADLCCSLIRNTNTPIDVHLTADDFYKLPKKSDTSQDAF